MSLSPGKETEPYIKLLCLCETAQKVIFLLLKCLSKKCHITQILNYQSDEECGKALGAILAQSNIQPDDSKYFKRNLTFVINSKFKSDIDYTREDLTPLCRVLLGVHAFPTCSKAHVSCNGIVHRNVGCKQQKVCCDICLECLGCNPKCHLSKLRAHVVAIRNLRNEKSHFTKKKSKEFAEELLNNPNGNEALVWKKNLETWKVALHSLLDILKSEQAIDAAEHEAHKARVSLVIHTTKDHYFWIYFPNGQLPNCRPEVITRKMEICFELPRRVEKLKELKDINSLSSQKLSEEFELQVKKLLIAEFLLEDTDEDDIVRIGLSEMVFTPQNDNNILQFTFKIKSEEAVVPECFEYTTGEAPRQLRKTITDTINQILSEFAEIDVFVICNGVRFESISIYFTVSGVMKGTDISLKLEKVLSDLPEHPKIQKILKLFNLETFDTAILWPTQTQKEMFQVTFTVKLPSNFQAIDKVLQHVSEDFNKWVIKFLQQFDCKQKELKMLDEALSSGEIVQKDQLQETDVIGYWEDFTVKRATWTNKIGKTKQVLLKKIDMDSISFRAFRNEAKMLLDLRHRNIVKCYGVCVDVDIHAIVTEKAGIWINGIECISLKDYLNQGSDAVSFKFITVALIQICKGLQYLHDHDIVHNNLMSANVLLTRSKHQTVFKIFNFGDCRKEVKNQTSDIKELELNARQSQAPFLSPERFKNNQSSNKKSDIYALGMLMYEVHRYDLDFPWQDEMQIITFGKIKEKVLAGKRPGFKSREYFPLIKNLENIIEYCWKQNPNDRPNVQQVLDLVALLHVQSDKTSFLKGFTDKRFFVIYEKLFLDKSLMFDLVKEVSKWSEDSVTNTTKYLENVIENLNARKKKIDLAGLAGNAVKIAGIATAMFGMSQLIFFTIIPAVVLFGLGSAAVSGEGSGTSLGSSFYKYTKTSDMEKNVKEEFDKNGIDLNAFVKLVDKIYKLSHVFSNDLEMAFEAINCFLLGIWTILRNTISNSTYVEWHSFDYVAFHKTVSKERQKIKDISCEQAVLAQGLRRLNIPQDDILTGSTDETPAILQFYEIALKDFWYIKEVIDSIPKK